MANRRREMLGQWAPWRWPRRAWQCLTAGTWKLALCRVLAVVAAIGLGGLLFVTAGLMPIAASAGHWPITRVFLQFTMRRSVATHTIGIAVPALDDPAMVLKGAGHYASGCLPCHGAPGQPRALIVKQMVPEPPYLPPVVAELAPDELFWIVKHGIKYTAMPAWVAQQRDDEVWAMVAFLQRLPTLSAAQFRQLADGEQAARLAGSRAGSRLTTLLAPPSPALANCARCHGLDGMGRGNGAFPRLAGQSETYLLSSLHAYARGERHSGVMQPVAAGLGASEMQTLARYYATLGSADTTAPADHGQDVAAIARGAKLAREGVAARRIPACVACHGPDPTPRNPMYPQLAGQYADYLELQLTLFKDGDRGGTDYAPIMDIVADALDEGDIRDLALYYSSLPARPAGIKKRPEPRR
ncbi:c-type cytochrome [Lysobacter sp. A289]